MSIGLNRDRLVRYSRVQVIGGIELTVGIFTLPTCVILSAWSLTRMLMRTYNGRLPIPHNLLELHCRRLGRVDCARDECSFGERRWVEQRTMSDMGVGMLGGQRGARHAGLWDCKMLVCGGHGRDEREREGVEQRKRKRGVAKSRSLSQNSARVVAEAKGAFPLGARHPTHQPQPHHSVHSPPQLRSLRPLSGNSRRSFLSVEQMRYRPEGRCCIQTYSQHSIAVYALLQRGPRYFYPWIQYILTSPRCCQTIHSNRRALRLSLRNHLASLFPLCQDLRASDKRLNQLSVVVPPRVLAPAVLHVRVLDHVLHLHPLHGRPLDRDDGRRLWRSLFRLCRLLQELLVVPLEERHAL